MTAADLRPIRQRSRARRARWGCRSARRFQIGGGRSKQNFEGGALQYTGGGDPGIVLPVASVALSGRAAGQQLTLNLGQSLTLTATPMISNGADGAGPPGFVEHARTAKWSRSRRPAAAAVITAVGGGAASVQAASEGVASAKINFVVISPCCQIGDGAPSSVQQAFQDALTRNKLSVADRRCRRRRRGWAAATCRWCSRRIRARVYMLAQSDRLGTAYVVGGRDPGALPGAGRAGGNAGVSGQRRERGRHAAIRERRGAGAATRCGW